MGELRRLILAQAILLGGQCLLYFGVEALEGPPHNVDRGIDRRIPFAPVWVYIYVLWFPLIALFPLALYFASPLHYGRYMTAMAADIVLSLICYLAYPTTFRRLRRSAGASEGCFRLRCWESGSRAADVRAECGWQTCTHAVYAERYDIWR